MKKDILFSIRMRASSDGRHISGAEGIYQKEKVHEIVSSYINRALYHSRGRPDEINVKVSCLKGRPQFISSLKVITLAISNSQEARDCISTLLYRAEISKPAVKKALDIVYGSSTMRGAALISAQGAERLEPDHERGVRATAVGITGEAKESLSQRLSFHNLDNRIVREALAIASKVASHENVIAELCVSDDPDYTTGYVATRQQGYIRIPNIKIKGDDNGGRVFFVNDGVILNELIDYLEKKPVMINKISDIKGGVSVHDFIGSIAG